jgi:hypothetical protein
MDLRKTLSTGDKSSQSEIAIKTNKQTNKTSGLFLILGLKLCATTTWLTCTSFCCLSETGSHYVALAGQDLGLQTRLALNLQRSTCLCLLSAKIKSMCHQTHLSLSLSLSHLLSFFLSFFEDRVSLCSLGRPSVHQAGLELTEICLPLPPEC